MQDGSLSTVSFERASLMIRNKAKSNQFFELDNHVITFGLFSRCITSKPQEHSYHKKLSKVVFLDNVKDDKHEYLTITFSNMKAATHFITNHANIDTMKIELFGKAYNSHLVILTRNYKTYTIESID